MKRTLLTTLGLSVLLATGCASTGYAENTGADMGFAAWDADRDGMIANTEFQTGYTQNAWFNDVDTNRDGMLTNDEFATASTNWGIDGNAFGMWDANRDGMIDNSEFGMGTFSTWDRNRDGLLDENEFGMGDGWFD